MEALLASLCMWRRNTIASSSRIVVSSTWQQTARGSCCTTAWWREIVNLVRTIFQKRRREAISVKILISLLANQPIYLCHAHVGLDGETPTHHSQFYFLFLPPFMSAIFVWSGMILVDWKISRRDDWVHSTDLGRSEIEVPCYCRIVVSYRNSRKHKSMPKHSRLWNPLIYSPEYFCFGVQLLFCIDVLIN
jgi:hypothetical protein